MRIISRKEAKFQNLKHYFTGKECKNGHIELRFTSTGVCKTCNRVAVLNHRNDNLEKYLKKEKAYRTNPTSRKIGLKATAEWKKRNKVHCSKYQCARLSRQKKAIPKWANLEKIKEIYKNCPKGFEVDHIIPLNGKDVCGLHVENNLQYLTAEENLRKGNRH